MTIPEGFRLASGWEHGLSPNGMPWGCTADLGRGEECKADAPYIRKADMDGACADHAVQMGALVAVAPVVSAPVPGALSLGDKMSVEASLRHPESEEEGTPACDTCQNRQCFLDQIKLLGDELDGTRAALVAAEQRADRAEDKLRRIREVIGWTYSGDGNAHFFVIRQVEAVYDILREGK